MNYKNYTIVRATAGAGKTTGLLEAVYQAYVSFKNSKGIPPKILLSTYTVKAANEMSERLVLKAKNLGDQEFLSYVVSGSLEVGTLHSVFARILNKFVNVNENQSRYISQAKQKALGRAYLHKIIREYETTKEVDVENIIAFPKVNFQQQNYKGSINENHNKGLLFFEEGIRNLIPSKYDEEQLLDFFWTLYNRSNELNPLFSAENCLQEVFEQFLELKSELPELDAYKTREEAYAAILRIFEQEGKKARKYGKLVKFLEDNENSEEEIRHFYKQQRVLFDIYSKWNKEVDSYIQEKELFSLHDVELRTLKFLKSKQDFITPWHFCFFDEYQDINPIQEEILLILAKNSINYYVGDPFQSIYLFREANKEILIDKFKAIQSNEGRAEFRLNNYRTGSKIVEFVNALSKYLMKDFEYMVPKKEILGEVSVNYIEEGDVESEVFYIAEQLKKIDLEKESVAILSRRTKDLILCNKIFKRLNIESLYSGSSGYNKSLEVFEIISFLKFIYNSNDQEALLSLLTSFWFSISDLEIQQALAQSQKDELGLWDVVKENPKLKNLKKWIGFKETPARALKEFLTATDFLNYTQAMDPSGKREDNILKLLSALEKEEEKSYFNLLSFCEDLLKGNYIFESEENSSATGVTLMTVHGSKGLEFDHVFIIGTNAKNNSSSKGYYFNYENKLAAYKIIPKSEGEKRFYSPLYKKLVEKDKAENIQESYRLLYVAMTRAVKSLSIFGSGKLSKNPTSPNWFHLLRQFLEDTQQKNLYVELEGLSNEKKIEAKYFEDLEGAFFINETPLIYQDREAQSVTGSEALNQHYDGSKNLLYFSDSISEGVVFHEIAEKIKAQNEVDQYVEIYFEEQKEIHKKALNYLFEQKEFPFVELITTGEREWGFDYFSDSGKISGKVDLWGVQQENLWIVDYKTGSDKYTDKGFNQIEAYKNVLLDHLTFSPDQQSSLVEETVNNEAKDHSHIQKVYLVLCFPYQEKVFVKTISRN